jgi:hypothetical protein
MLVGVHAVIAMRTQTPELAITEDEGKAFMKSAQNVLRHYSVQTTQKTLDWVAFLGVAAGMYGTRAFAISVRRQAEAKSNSQERGTVLNWPIEPRPRPEPEPINRRARQPERRADRGQHPLMRADVLAEATPAPASAYTPSVPMGPEEEGAF